MNFTKSLIATLTLLFIPAAVLHAQTSMLDRGSINIAGDAAFTSSGSPSSGSDDRYTKLIISPTAHYFVLPGLAVGGDVVVGYASAKNSSATNFGAGPSVAYYFGRGERTVYPFISASLTLLRTISKNSVSDQSRSATAYRGSGGALLMLSRSVGITGELFYQGRNSEGNEWNTYGLAFGVSAFVF